MGRAALLCTLLLLMGAVQGVTEERGEVQEVEEEEVQEEEVEEEVCEVECSSIAGCGECISAPGCVYCTDPDYPLQER